MTRYLILPFLRSAMNRGVSVEQFLGGFMDGDEPAIRWIALHQEADSVVLSLYQAYDQGEGDLWDVYEFTPLSDDPDDDVEHEFPDLEDALEFARIHYGADPGRFVNAGVVQDEYHDYFVRRQAEGNAA